jgi:hypothetical protein
MYKYFVYFEMHQNILRYIISNIYTYTSSQNILPSISAVGVKAVEMDEINTNKIIINNEGYRRGHIPWPDWGVRGSHAYLHLWL